MPEMRQLFWHAQPGAKSTVVGHIRRGERIAAAINERWGLVTVRQWQVKHLRWFLEDWCLKQGEAKTTRYDYWLTVRVITAALGKLDDWEPHLRGEWCRRGVGGRPPKLVHHRNGRR